MKKLLIAMLLLIGMIGTAQDFSPVWEGNGTGHMNIYIVDATLDKQPLQAGDQVAVYSGDKCVGYTTVLSDYQHKEFLVCDVITSMNDGTGNGFNVNDSILIKIWDKSLNKQVDYLTASYYTDLDFWSVGKFSQGGSAFISLEASNIHKKKVLLHSGLNTLSFSYDLSSTSLPEVFKTLIDDGILLKVQDKTGRSFEKVNQTNWINSIGPLDPDAIYTVIVNKDCEFEYQGILK